MEAWIRTGVCGALALALAGCGQPTPGHDATVDAGDVPVDTGPEAPVGPHLIGSLRYAAPVAWAEPVADYIYEAEDRLGAGADFMRGIHDLVVWQDRLYLGYGDANLNLGRVVTIQFRSFSSPDNPVATDEFGSDDEQLDRYRILGPDLFLAGIDSTEDAWLGNVYYRRPGGQWVKSRTLQGGVHVHDVVEFDGAIWAVGSGATQAEWTAGNIYGHLWRSADRGQGFEIRERVWNDTVGDSRLVRLLPLDGQMYVFGYRSDAMGRIRVPLSNYSYHGTTLTPLPMEHPLRSVFVSETDLLPDGGGLVRGIDISGSTRVAGIWRVDRTGTATPLARFAAHTVQDVYVHPATGEVLFLSYDGNTLAERTRWTVRVTVSRDLSSFTELMHFDTDVAPASIACWRDGIYYGTEDGKIMRSVGMP